MIFNLIFIFIVLHNFGQDADCLACENQGYDTFGLHVGKVCSNISYSGDYILLDFSSQPGTLPCRCRIQTTQNDGITYEILKSPGENCNTEIVFNGSDKTILSCTKDIDEPIVEENFDTKSILIEVLPIDPSRPTDSSYCIEITTSWYEEFTITCENYQKNSYSKIPRVTDLFASSTMEPTFYNKDKNNTQEPVFPIFNSNMTETGFQENTTQLDKKTRKRKRKFKTTTIRTTQTDDNDPWNKYPFDFDELDVGDTFQNKGWKKWRRKKNRKNKKNKNKTSDSDKKENITLKTHLLSQEQSYSQQQMPVHHITLIATAIVIVLLLVIGVIVIIFKRRLQKKKSSRQSSERESRVYYAVERTANEAEEEAQYARFPLRERAASGTYATIVD